jgi:hypothetical protein
MKKDICTTANSFSTTNGTTASITTTPSTKVMAGGSPVRTGSQTVIASGGSQGPCNGIAGTATMNPTASKTKVDGNFVIRVDDSVDVTVNGINPNGGGPGIPAPCTFTSTVKISNAGQSKVQGE